VLQQTHGSLAVTIRGQVYVSVSQCVAVCRSMSQCVTVWQRVAACCSVLQCVVVCLAAPGSLAAAIRGEAHGSALQ